MSDKGCSEDKASKRKPLLDMSPWCTQLRTCMNDVLAHAVKKITLISKEAGLLDPIKMIT